jgi:hypothetical protein
MRAHHEHPLCRSPSEATAARIVGVVAASIAAMDPRLIAAVQNNARWCDLVCRAHGLPTVVSEQMWTAPEGSQRLYPDAMTLAPRLDADFVLRQIETSPGCSVKDSFADLDLSQHGFIVLFDARWLYREPASPRTRPRLDWQLITSNDDLERWAAAADLKGIIRPELLDDPTVRVLAVRDEQAVRAVRAVRAGAIMNRTGATVGLSNVFTTATTPTSAWRDLPGAVGDVFGGVPIVGYEHGKH